MNEEVQDVFQASIVTTYKDETLERPTLAKIHERLETGQCKVHMNPFDHHITISINFVED